MTKEASTSKPKMRSPTQKRRVPFDVVIITAAPQFAQLTIKPAPKNIPEEIPYVSLHVTLFSTPHRISPSFYEWKPHQQIPEVVLTTLQPHNKGEPITQGVQLFSVSLLRRGLNIHASPPRYENVYKIFSSEPIDDVAFSKIFALESPAKPLPPSEDLSHTNATAHSASDISWLYRKVWSAYPYLAPRYNIRSHQAG